MTKIQEYAENVKIICGEITAHIHVELKIVRNVRRVLSSQDQYVLHV